MKLQLTSVRSNRHVQMICSSRPDGRWVGCLLGVQVAGGVMHGQLLNPLTQCAGPVTTVLH